MIPKVQVELHIQQDTVYCGYLACVEEKRYNNSVVMYTTDSVNKVKVQTEFMFKSAQVSKRKLKDILLACDNLFTSVEKIVITKLPEHKYWSIVIYCSDGQVISYTSSNKVMIISDFPIICKTGNSVAVVSDD